jgi:three-Cys-motif partner protein
MPTPEGFYDERLDQSRVKSAIVATYFRQWARVMKGAAKRYPDRAAGSLAYIDLFAGPGRYDDGTPSTPLLVLQEAIRDAEIAEVLVTFFNEKDPTRYANLCSNIQGFPGVECLQHPPIIKNLEVGEEIVRQLNVLQLPPTLLFVDPWGYRGLTLALIDSVLKRWGCDCILFFNYNRINPGLSNPFVQEHMDALFGAARAAQLRQQLEGMSPEEREATIVEAISQALVSVGGRYVLPFCFKDERGTRTSHHLVFVTKEFKGLDIMKSIMAGESSAQEQGVASFAYCPATERQPFLFEFGRPLDDLAESLCRQFAGWPVRVDALYRMHSPRTPFTSTNYKTVLKRLEAEGRITVDPPAHLRRKIRGEVTLKDEAVITFPPRSQ